MQVAAARGTLAARGSSMAVERGKQDFVPAEQLGGTVAA
jgi:hypothetical protein